MKAPSEKHLEDWIVSRNGDLFNDDPIANGSIYNMVGRQCRLGKHRADLLITDPGRLYVVELKQGEIDTKALAQCLRYMGYLQQIWRQVVYKLGYTMDSASAIHPFCFSGMLIGHSVSDDVFVSAMAANVIVYLYDYTGDTYKFNFAGLEQPKYLFSHAAAEEYAYGYVGEAMRAIFNSYRQYDGSFLQVNDE